MVTQKEIKEKTKTRQEKIGGYFLNMSQLSFAGMVIGEITPLLNEDAGSSYWAIALGVFGTILFAMIGLTLIFLIECIFGVGFLIWLNTKSGKKWLGEE